MSGQGQGEGCGGCGTLIVAVLLIGAVAAAAISLTALIDPFDWMPPVGEIWEDCDNDWKTSVNECDLHRRFPGFWEHAIANFAYTIAATGLLLALAAAVSELRQACEERFASQPAADRYGEARLALTSLTLLGGLLGALPIIVALA